MRLGLELIYEGSNWCPSISEWARVHGVLRARGQDFLDRALLRFRKYSVR
jgi:hypothetical protein